MKATRAVQKILANYEDILEDRLAGVSPTAAGRRRARQLAFTAWTSILGLMTMLGVADATDDPVAHPHAALLTTLSEAFDETGRPL